MAAAEKLVDLRVAGAAEEPLAGCASCFGATGTNEDVVEREQELRCGGSGITTAGEATVEEPPWGGATCFGSTGLAARSHGNVGRGGSASELKMWAESL